MFCFATAIRLFCWACCAYGYSKVGAPPAAGVSAPMACVRALCCMLPASHAAASVSCVPQSARACVLQPPASPAQEAALHAAGSSASCSRHACQALPSRLWMLTQRSCCSGAPGPRERGGHDEHLHRAAHLAGHGALRGALPLFCCRHRSLPGSCADPSVPAELHVLRSRSAAPSCASCVARNQRTHHARLQLGLCLRNAQATSAQAKCAACLWQSVAEA